MREHSIPERQHFCRRVWDAMVGPGRVEKVDDGPLLVCFKVLDHHVAHNVVGLVLLGATDDLQ